MPTIEIKVKDEAEGTAIARALDDPETRAFVVIVGVLLPFSERARARVLNYVADFARDPDTHRRPAPVTADPVVEAER